MQILLFVIILFLLIVLVPMLTLASWLAVKIAGIRKRFSKKDTGSKAYTSTSGTSNPKKGKIIPKDEGEYVDFEEIP